uniref:Odorant-binding protein 12 n=1 Tax=Ectropis obliqua TaxID=248899 RepID=A0A1L2BLE3_ECTOB|nr:odorant-binding protein 12 [Ectropis obliqua]
MNYTLLCLSLTITSVSLLVTCSKLSTETTKVTATTESSNNMKPDDNNKELDDSKPASDTSRIGIDTKYTSNDTNALYDEVMDVLTTCNESFRIEISYLVSLNETGSFPNETDKTPKCFLRCVLQSLEVASMDDGKIDPKRAAEVFGDQRENIEETATLCAQRDEKCHCEMAYNFLKCLFSTKIENVEKSKT